jgi:Tfp pilus assembly protein PilN
MLNNFLYRVAQYLHDNRARLIRIALILAAILLAVFLIFTGVARWKDWQYQTTIKDLDARFQQRDADAKAGQARADGLQIEIDALKAENKKREAQAKVLESALDEARKAVRPLKEKYEEIRNSPVVPVDVDCADLCARLAVLGYACKKE